MSVQYEYGLGPEISVCTLIQEIEYAVGGYNVDVTVHMLTGFDITRCSYQKIITAITPRVKVPITW